MAWCCRWNLSAFFNIFFCFVLLYNKSLNDRSLGEQWILFPSTSSWETSRFSGNKIHCSPRDQSLSVKYYLQAAMYYFVYYVNRLMRAFLTIFRRFLNPFRRLIFWPTFFGILFFLVSEYLAKLASSGKYNHLGYDAAYSKHEKSFLIPLHSL